VKPLSDLCPALKNKFANGILFSVGIPSAKRLWKSLAPTIVLLANSMVNVSEFSLPGLYHRPKRMRNPKHSVQGIRSA
jgi:hypothetical protein